MLLVDRAQKAVHADDLDARVGLERHAIVGRIDVHALGLVTARQRTTSASFGNEAGTAGANARTATFVT